MNYNFFMYVKGYIDYAIFHFETRKETKNPTTAKAYVMNIDKHV